MNHTNTKRGIAPIAVLIIALLAVGGGAAVVKNKNTQKKAEKAAKEEKAAQDLQTLNDARSIQVRLESQNNSGQSGQAVLAQVGTSTVKVIVNLTGKPSGVPMPAHIHVGACPNPGAVKYPLTAVGTGAAQTELNTTLDALLKELPLAINVHKSAAEAGVYVACGNISTSTAAKNDAAPKADASGQAKKTDRAQAESVVTYSKDGFSPKVLNVKKGETVTFVNKGDIQMWVASAPHPAHTDYPAFDQLVPTGKDSTFEFTFDKEGSWKYHNHSGASHTGTINVK